MINDFGEHNIYVAKEPKNKPSEKYY